MLMEKLEKAEEKRQKALARWKEQAARRRELAQRRSEQFGDHQVTSGSSTSQQSPSTSEQCNFPAKSDTTQEFKNNVSRASIEDKQSAGSQLAEILQMTGDMDNNTIIQTPSEPGCQYNNNMTVQRMESNIELDQMRLDQTQLDTNRTYLFDFPIYVRERSRLQVLPEEQENANSDEENTAVKQEQRRIPPGIFSTPPTVQPSNEVSDVCSSRLNRSGGI
ncbi:hypothetical protein FGIG_04152 [Fasciola gigantica]|uniref:Uncharacterized protein n=1 Tax=Fasciola gigantica TaxID=46835 RepID=A0A504YU69_FASGI|nr:hypothetical protein FGIG_04152 [Fasciola gigantica]